jgi:hypothetical protein
MINLLFVKYRGIKGNETKEVVINTKKIIKKCNYITWIKFKWHYLTT